jgi:hypothetical protein
MAIAGLIMRSYSQFASHIQLCSGHQVQLQDLDEHNAILIGSPISNPWAQLYEDRLNFAVDLAPDGRIIFRNKMQRAQESAQYPDQAEIDHHKTYSRLVFLPGVKGGPVTLLIAGTTAQATQAAGELVTDPKRLDATLRAMGLDPKGAPHFFEVLIRMDNFVGGAFLPEVVAWRTEKVNS